MIGKCPNCEISLKEPPFNNRVVNEVMLTLKYRDLIENNSELDSIESAGYCQVCYARLADLEIQKSNEKKKVVVT